MMRPTRTLGLLLLALALSVQSAAAQTPPGADSAPPRLFDIPAGLAEQTLATFAAQSRQAVVFPVEQMRGVPTSAVRGIYTPLDGLRRMLDGSAFAAALDPATGTLAVRPIEESGIAVELPPFLVEEANGLPWRHAEVPGAEVLSLWPDDMTRQLIDRQQRLHSALELLVPREFRAPAGLPVGYVLFREDLLSRTTGELVESLRQTGEVARAGEGARVRFLPNFRFWDQDSMAVFFVIDPRVDDPSALALTPGYLRHVLESCTPPLPAWYVEGLLTLYETVRLTVPPVRPPLAAPSARSPEDYDTVNLRSFVWLSARETAAMAQLHHRAGSLPPEFKIPSLATMLTSPYPPEGDRETWRHTCALFLRWAFTPDALLATLDSGARSPGSGHGGATVLWNFLARTRRGPVTERDFRECFGRTFAEADRELREYLPASITNRFVFRLTPPPRAPAATVEILPASPSDISRLKGRLDRLEISAVRALQPQYPHLAAKYAGQARRTLRRAYDAGDRDPRLLAELGLCECDAGDDGAAQPLLEAAVRSGVVRPRAYCELARIHYAGLRAASPGREPGQAQCAAVLDLLERARAQSPRLPEAYELTAEIWVRGEASLEAPQLLMLEEGVRLFPRRARLGGSTAILLAAHGHVPRALALLARSLEAVADPREAEQLRKLQARLSAARPS